MIFHLGIFGEADLQMLRRYATGRHRIQVDSLKNLEPELWDLYVSTVKKAVLLYTGSYCGLHLTFDMIFGRLFKQPLADSIKVEWISRVLSSVNATWMLQGVTKEFIK